MDADDSQNVERAPTIYDVARLAGVAPSTVSRALSRPGRVSVATAAKVRAAARSIGYQRSPEASPLDKPRTRLIAMVVADIGNAVFTENIRGADIAAEEAGYTMFVVDSRESSVREQRAVTRFIDEVEGLILTSPRMSAAGILDIAKQRPVVVLNREVGGLPSVLTNGGRGAALGAEHLAKLGHEELTYLSGPEASWADGDRWRRLEEASETLGMKVRRIGPNLPTLAGGARAAQRWSENTTTGVIAFNDMMAIGFIRQIQALGLRVPDDVSVIGFDNSRVAQLTQPSITSVASPLPQQGAAAVRILLSMVGGARAPERPHYLPVRLMERESTGKARLARISV